MKTITAVAALNYIKRGFLKAIGKPGKELDLVNKICRREDADNITEHYGWIEPPPAPELLLDELRSVGLLDALVAVENNVYVTSVRIGRRLLRVDKTKTLENMGAMLALVMKRFPIRLLIHSIEAGILDLSFDGVPFFDAAHPVRGDAEIWGNLIAGSGIQTEELRNDLSLGLARLRRAQSPNGEPLHEGLGEVVVICPPELRNMHTAVHGTIISNTTNNQFEGQKITVAHTPRLADRNDWYGVHVDGTFPAAVIQQLEGITNEELGEGSDHWFKHEEAVFKVRWDGTVKLIHHGNWFKVTNPN